ncbi:hypothetical protein EJ02DRAFT_437088 [Clathrospora elynae]|uniref:Uncharacterized protein n=1 Tax=Clathrospora elynae TaxID=706981 RepID=A0A6A5SF74_9PLEO|nr:hypothetical protein EJ02DRAFT_437088 [Clathrospora elynae]
MAHKIHPRFRLMINLLRIAFLISLKPETCIHLARYVFRDFYNEPQHAWVVNVAVTKIRNNCSQWKSRGIKSMRLYVKKALQRDPDQGLAKCVQPDLLRPMFGERFSVEDFNTVFTFVAPAVDWSETSNLKESGHKEAKGVWWARTIFCILAAHTKMILDVEAGTQPYSAQLTHNGIKELFNQIGDNDVLQKHRPEVKDFSVKEDYLYRHNRNQANSGSGFNPNATNLIGCDLPPGATWEEGEHYDNIDTLGEQHLY